jgi:hypothetical protein
LIPSLSRFIALKATTPLYSLGMTTEITSGFGEFPDAKLPISHSVQTSQNPTENQPLQEGAKVVDKMMLQIPVEDIPKLLESWEVQIIQKTNELLLANEAKATPDLDGIFAYHTTYADFCGKNRFAERARRLWLRHLEPLVDASEARLKAANPKAHIHRGAPLYNVGLCSFMLGDFDRALQFIAEAGVHDEILGRGDSTKILIGDNQLSEQVFIRPLTGVFKSVGADYAKITGYALDGKEFKLLLKAMAGRPSDAIQAVVALHRLGRSLIGHQNQGTAVIRFRALAELLHLVESFLRQFQTTVDGELGNRLNHLVAANPVVKGARYGFDSDRKKWVASNKCDWNSHQTMNWISSETGLRIASAATPAGATGVIVYFCHQFRNSLLHVNEENLTIFQNKDGCVKAVGWVLGMLRACARVKEGKFSPADFA